MREAERVVWSRVRANSRFLPYPEAFEYQDYPLQRNQNPETLQIAFAINSRLEGQKNSPQYQDRGVNAGGLAAQDNIRDKAEAGWINSVEASGPDYRSELQQSSNCHGPRQAVYQIRYNQGTFKGKINPAAAYAMLLDLRLRFKPVYFFCQFLPVIYKRMAEIPLRINAVCTCQIIYSQTIDILG